MTIYAKLAAALLLVALIVGGYFAVQHRGVVKSRTEAQAKSDAETVSRK